MFNQMRQQYALVVELRARLLRVEAERDDALQVAIDLVAASSAPKAPRGSVSSHQERVAKAAPAASRPPGLWRPTSKMKPRARGRAAFVPSVSAINRKPKDTRGLTRRLPKKKVVLTPTQIAESVVAAVPYSTNKCLNWVRKNHPLDSMETEAEGEKGDGKSKKCWLSRRRMAGRLMARR